jgi:hypothetical protein
MHFILPAAEASITDHEYEACGPFFVEDTPTSSKPLTLALSH